MINLSRQPLEVGTLQLKLFDFLKDSVPKIIVYENSWTVGSFKNNEVAHQLINQISWWLFEGEPEEEIAKLEKLNNPSNICGHVFKPGEATYSCRECAADSTCVFCQKCFRKSQHVNHKYKFHSACGGGVCDCGDKEAWKKDPYCQIHIPVANRAMVDVRNQLPPDLRSRAEKMLLLLVDYIVNFLTIERTESSDLPEYLAVANPNDSYMTIVYNDEFHTFDYVIEILQQAVFCSTNVASDFATIIDREGRTAIKIGSQVDCNAARDVIVNSRGVAMMTIGNRRRTPLTTRVAHSLVVAHQEFSLALLTWLNKISSQSDGLRHAISSVLLGAMKDDVSGRTYIAQLMTSDKKLWKLARTEYQQMIVATILRSAEQKKAFATQFCRSYVDIFTGFLTDDHNHHDSITSLSVQIFTVPTLAHHLLAEEQLLSVVFKVVLDTICRKTRTGTGQLYELSTLKLKKNLERLEYSFFDLKYCLSAIPTAWNDKMKENFKSFFRTFLDFLACLEGMDSVVRKTNAHLEHEPEWESGVTLQMRLVTITQQILNWCSSSVDVFHHCLEAAIKKLKRFREAAQPSFIDQSFDMYNTYRCVDHDVSTKPVSVYYPLTRCVAGLLTECGNLNISLSVFPDIRSFILDLAEGSLCSLALCAQVNAGAWRRNGMGLANQVFYSRHILCRAESFDRDVQMLQACAALVDPNHLCLALHRKMNLGNTEQFDEYLTSLLEEYISILVYICSERYCKGVGQRSDYEMLRREMVHLLARGAKPHSKITKLMPPEVTSHPSWDTILREVADLKPSTNIRMSAKYELKSSCLNEISPCFYHYTTASDQSNAMSETIRRRKAHNQSVVSIPRPAPSFTEPFAPAVNVLLCPFLFKFLSDTFQKYTPFSATSHQWSDRLFEKLLYLIGFGIIEERERVKVDMNDPFRFCQKLTDAGLTDAIANYVTLSVHKENVIWISNAVVDVNNRRKGIVMSPAVEVKSLASAGDESRSRLKKEAAMKRRENMISHMKRMQQKFMSNLSPELVVQQEQEERSSPTPPTSVVIESPSLSSVCTDLSWQMSSVDEGRETEVCILCQDATRTGACMVMAAFAQLSSVMSKRRIPPEEAVKHFGDISNPAGIHVSTCSHVMHFDCWKQFFKSVKEHDERRPSRMRRFLSIFSTQKNEFLCPLCSRLSNCILPVIAHKEITDKRNLLKASSSSSKVPTLQQWMSVVEDLIDPPDPTPQDVVIRLAAHSTSMQDLDVYVDASDVLVGGETSVSEPHPSSEDMDVDPDPYLPVFDVMIKCIKTNCLTGDASNEMIAWLLVASTFSSTEVVARFKEAPLFTPASVRIKQALSSITRSCFLSSKYYQGSEATHVNRMKLFLGKSPDSLLQSNIFFTFIITIFSCDCLRGKLHTNSISNDKHILFLSALAQLVQIILFIDLDEVSTDQPPTDSTLIQLFNQVRSYAGLPEESSISEEKLKAIIHRSFSPFIRCCALFLRYVTNVSPPESLESADSFDELCCYLGLPTDILSYFDVGGTTSLDPLVQRWCSNPALMKVLEMDHLTFPSLSDVNHLIGLDEDYSDVTAKTSEFKCPRFRTHDDSVTPATCLICGVMLCSQSYCCQRELDGANVGSCSYHSSQCSFGAGLFLKGRDCTLVFLNQTRGCFRPAPYLDEYGETDQGLRRHNPLRLDSDRFKELQLLWLSHSIPDTIVRETVLNQGLINMDWVHL